MKKYEFDWGTNGNESFQSYITRIENQIDECLANGEDIQNLVLGTGISIFNDIIFSAMVTNNRKGEAIIEILQRVLNREPLVSDLSLLTEYVKGRLTNKIKRKNLLSPNFKLLE